MKAIILNFETSEVLIADIPKNVEDAEQYLTDDLDLNLTNCEWMFVDELRIVNL
jgi:hypothetical protein